LLQRANALLEEQPLGKQHEQNQQSTKVHSALRQYDVGNITSRSSVVKKITPESCSRKYHFGRAFGSRERSETADVRSAGAPSAADVTDYFLHFPSSSMFRIGKSSARPESQSALLFFQIGGLIGPKLLLERVFVEGSLATVAFLKTMVTR